MKWFLGFGDLAMRSLHYAHPNHIPFVTNGGPNAIIAKLAERPFRHCDKAKISLSKSRPESFI
jgi:hypothetical protein